MSFEAAARFLVGAFEWPTPDQDPAEFFVNVHSRVPGSLYGIGGRACRSLEEALNNVKYNLEKGADVYVCMSTQKTANEKFAKNGYKFFTAIRNQGNVRSHRSLFVDVDVKPGSYATTEEAAEAFGKFRREAGLPVPSFLIRSGSGGFHVHWTTDDPMDTVTWQVMSQQLVSAMRASGFHADYGVSIDSVRLLRVPGTLNYKHTPPTPVTLDVTNTSYDVTYLQGILSKFPIAKAHVNPVGTPNPQASQVVWPANMPPPPSTMVFKPLAPGIVKPLPSLESLCSVCPAIKNSFDTGGKLDGQPLWWMMAKVATFTSDGLNGFLDMSDQHAGFDEAAAAALYDRSAREQAARDMGWPRCRTIHDQGATQCTTCPHLAKDKTPFHAMLEATTPRISEDDKLKSNLQGNRVVDELTGVELTGYTIMHKKLYRVLPAKGAAKEGEQEYELVCDKEVGKLQGQKNPYQLNIELDGELFIISAEHAASTEQLSKTLHQQGYWIKTLHVPRFKDFMSSWMSSLKGRKIDLVTSERYGWSYDDGKPAGFVYAKTKYNCKGDVPVVPQDKTLLDVYEPTGRLEPWLEASKLITNQKRPALNAILATAFAAPLMNFTGESGFVASAFSPGSGKQKSSAMKVGQSVWGHPKTGMNSLSDTPNSVQQKLGQLKNLPLFYDELRLKEDDRRGLEMLFQLSQGKSKAKLTKDSRQYVISDWSTMMQTASNSSLIAFAATNAKATTAGLHRVFEYEVPDPTDDTGIIDQGIAGSILRGLNDNYGHAGMVYAKYLGARGDEVQERVIKGRDLVVKALGATTDERFWTTAIALLTIGASISNELKLTDIELDPFKNFLVRSFERLRRLRDGTNTDLARAGSVHERLAQYLNSRKRQTMITDHMPKRRRGAPQLCTVINVQEILHAQSFAVRVARDDQVIRISRYDFEAWLTKEGIAPSMVFDSLKHHLKMVEHRAAVTGGVRAYPTATEQVFEFDNSNNQLAPIYDF